MTLTWDEAKRQATIKERGLDFADCVEVFSGPGFEFPDTRKDYPEIRLIRVGFLRGRMVVLVYTPRGDARHIFSMRKANEREIKRYQARLG